MFPPKKRLLDQVRDRLRLKNYTYRTEKSYLYWIKQDILFHNKRHPNDMGGSEIEQFPTNLASTKKVAPSTQNQALSALLYLYHEVLDKPLDLTFQHARDLVSGHGEVSLPFALAQKYPNAAKE
jgi:hypothetical protein